MQPSFDLAVIGAGPGGYVCAIRAAQLGQRVVCIDQAEQPGGTCLRVGCIPSKALLHASHLYAQAGCLDDLGIVQGPPRLDLAAMMAYKAEAVAANTKGVGFLLKKNQVEYIAARARLAAPGQIEIGQGGKQTRRISARRIVIATGARPAAIPAPGLEIDEETVLSSTGALSLPRVPRRLLVIGAGYIGLELGSVWQRLGAETIIVEMEKRIAPGMDGELARQFQRLLARQGLVFKLGAKVARARRSGGEVELAIATADGETQTLTGDAVLVAAGRSPCSRDLGLEEVGVAFSPQGFIQTGPDFATACPGLYAIGDVRGGAQLAHKASEEGAALAESLAGQKSQVDYQAIPGVVYTQPEAAAVGQTEEDVKNSRRPYRTGKFPFTANGRARVNRTPEGFVKILADRQTDRILGVHILGAEAGAMIAEAVAALAFGGSAEDIARIAHAHPTLSEAMKEAALNVAGHAIHM